MALFNRRGNRERIYTDRSSTMVSRWTHPPERNTAEWMQAYGRADRTVCAVKRRRL
ncbi:MAG: hypothetical protein FWF10_11305 [Clostridiales bacterium]|nr:hypothetical protein [Clostridiales bacterium]